MHAQEAKQSMRGGSMMGWLFGPACLGVVEQIDQRLPGHNARLHRRGQLAVHSLAVSLARDAEVLRKGPALGSAHAHEPSRAPRRAHCRHHRGAGRIALHRDQCHCGEHQYHCGEQSQICSRAGTSMAFGEAFEELPRPSGQASRGILSSLPKAKRDFRPTNSNNPLHPSPNHISTSHTRHHPCCESPLVAFAVRVL